MRSTAATRRLLGKNFFARARVFLRQPHGRGPGGFEQHHAFVWGKSAMRILTHVCCGPCSITVLQRLREMGHDSTAFFFNPNIHPLAEYLRRREGAAQVALHLAMPVIFADTLPEQEQRYTDPWIDGEAAWDRSFFTGKHAAAPPPAVNPAVWLKATAGRGRERCLFCWRTRLAQTAKTAALRGYEGFTSSLLYSRYQDHEAIRQIGEALSEEYGLAFVYEDFRVYWQEGIRISKEWDIYRQQYCGCVFSEYERYFRDGEKAFAGP